VGTSSVKNKSATDIWHLAKSVTLTRDRKHKKHRRRRPAVPRGQRSTSLGCVCVCVCVGQRRSRGSGQVKSSHSWGGLSPPLSCCQASSDGEASDSAGEQRYSGGRFCSETVGRLPVKAWHASQRVRERVCVCVHCVYVRADRHTHTHRHTHATHTRDTLAVRARSGLELSRQTTWRAAPQAFPRKHVLHV